MTKTLENLHYCVDLFCTFAVVSVFCTVCSSDFVFSIIWSLASRGG